MRKVLGLLALVLVFSSCSLFQPSPEEAQELLRTALSNFSTNLTHKSTFTLKLASSDPKQAFGYQLNSTSSLDHSVANEPQSEFQLKLEQSTADSEAPFVLELQGLSIADKTYLKFLQAPQLAESELDTWQVLATKDFGLASASFLPTGNLSSGFLSLEQPEITKQQKMANYLATHALFQITKVYPYEELDSGQAYHFSATLDTAAWSAYLQEQATLSGTALTAEEVQNLSTSFKDSKLLAEFFIDKVSGRLVKVLGGLELGAAEQKLTGTLTLTLSYDAKLQLTAPTKSSEFIFPVGTAAEDVYAEENQTLDTPACQQALRDLQALATDASPEIRNAKTAALRLACQENPESSP